MASETVCKKHRAVLALVGWLVTVTIGTVTIGWLQLLLLNLSLPQVPIHEVEIRR